MFDYKFEIDTDKMLVKVIFHDDKTWNKMDMSEYRYINYKDNFGRSLFFNIENNKFPSYLRCENFPWERLKNLNEIINFVTIYDQYVKWTKHLPDMMVLKPYFDVDELFSTAIYTSSTLTTLLTCSCLCSKE